MDEVRKSSVINRLSEVFLDEQKIADLLKILVYMSRIEENDYGKASIWKMLNSLYRHSKVVP